MGQRVIRGLLHRRNIEHSVGYAQRGKDMVACVVRPCLAGELGDQVACDGIVVVTVNVDSAGRCGQM